MDPTVVTTEIEGALEAQLRLAGDDPAVTGAAEALMIALEPAIDRAAGRLAAQAAEEADSQLPGHHVTVELRRGLPILVVRGAADTEPIDTDELEARITLRLSDHLKTIIEEAAGETGDSMNTYVVKTLASRARERTAGRRYTGRIET